MHTHTAFYLESQDVHSRPLRRDPNKNPPGLNSSCFHIWTSWWRFFLPRRRINRLVGSLFLKHHDPGHPRVGPEPPELQTTSEVRVGVWWGVVVPRVQSHWGQLFRVPGVLGTWEQVKNGSRGRGVVSGRWGSAASLRVLTSDGCSGYWTEGCKQNASHEVSSAPQISLGSPRAPAALWPSPEVDLPPPTPVT